MLKKVEVPKPKAKKGPVAKKKKRNVGVLAFKSSFTDLIDEVPVAKLGSDARVKKVNARIPGEARASRSLVASQASGGGSSGIGNFGVSRNLGNGGQGGAVAVMATRDRSVVLVLVVSKAPWRDERGSWPTIKRWSCCITN